MNALNATKLRALVPAVAITLALLAGAAEAGDLTFKVRQDKLVGGREGHLTISEERIEYRSEDGKHGGSWAYQDIRQVEIVSPTRVRIITYDDRERLLGADRSYTLELVDGRLTREVSDFLRSKLSRPLVTSFTDHSGDVLAELAVKHNHRIGGCEGTVSVFEDKLVYASEEEESSRTWAWTDVRSVSRPDPYRLEIATYERELGGRRSFTFDLKAPISDEDFDRIWQRVYRPTPLTVLKPRAAADEHAGHAGHEH
jgi:hypothetical protein